MPRVIRVAETRTSQCGTRLRGCSHPGGCLTDVHGERQELNPLGEVGLDWRVQTKRCSGAKGCHSGAHAPQVGLGPR